MTAQVRRSRLLHCWSGQALVVVAVMLPVMLSVIGLAIDGGIVLDARRDLQNLADGAARAGAMQVDVERYRSSDGSEVVLLPAEAETATLRYLSGRELTVNRFDVGAESLSVEVRREVPLSFLTVLGFDVVRIRADSTASIRHGIEQSQP